MFKTPPPTDQKYKPTDVALKAWAKVGGGLNTSKVFEDGLVTFKMNPITTEWIEYMDGCIFMG